MRKLKFLTVVYRINDEAAFKDEFDRVKSLFGRSDEKPWAIGAMSCDDELYRVQLIEELLDKNHDLFDLTEAIREIIQCPDLDVREKAMS